MEPKKIIIVDDHPILRVGIKVIIDKMAGVELIGEACNGKEAQALVKSLQPDLITLDLTMPEMDGKEFVRWLEMQKLQPRPKILVLTQMLPEVMQSGLTGNRLVSGLVHKSSVLKDLDVAISTALGGGHFYSKEFEKFVEACKQKDVQDEQVSYYDTLTKTEKRILKLVSQKLSSEEIAERLVKSIRTIENHRYRICQKLQVTGNNGLIMHALTNKYLIEQL